MPPSSPDLISLDYYLWNVVERETNKHPHNALESFRVVTLMNEDHLIRTCKRFRQRIESVVAVEGEFIE